MNEREAIRQLREALETCTEDKFGYRGQTFQSSRVAEALADTAEIANQEPPQTVPVPWEYIVKAINAVGDEAQERGRLYPQNSDEQMGDRRAIRRICGMIEWYATEGGSCAMKLPDWPTICQSENREPETWSSDPPTEPGWYWWSGDLDKPVRVLDIRGSMCTARHGVLLYGSGAWLRIKTPEVPK